MRHLDLVAETMKDHDDCDPPVLMLLEHVYCYRFITCSMAMY